MKLYSLLKDKDFKTITVKEVVNILRECGVENEFKWLQNNPHFVNFIFYFINAYSFESSLMDTTTFNESLAVIENKFEFNFNRFKENLGEDFDDKYCELLSFYLRTQNNREFELLMAGLRLYNQMLSASVLTTLKTQSKKNEGVVNIDYETKNNLFIYCLQLNKEISLLEEKLEDSKAIIEGAIKANPKVKNRMKRIEEV